MNLTQLFQPVLKWNKNNNNNSNGFSGGASGGNSQATNSNFGDSSGGGAFSDRPVFDGHAAQQDETAALEHVAAQTIEYRGRDNRSVTRTVANRSLLDGLKRGDIALTLCKDEVVTIPTQKPQ